MKKMLAATMAMMMAFSLTACSGNSNTAATTAAPAQDSGTEAPETKAEEPDSKEEGDEAAASGEGYTVALCNYSIGNSWRAQMEQEFIAEARSEERRVGKEC